MRKANFLTSLAVAILGLAAAQPAQAGELGFSSSGSVGITVVIPPIAAALQAQAAGAVGLWTVQSTQSALMINLPDAIDPDPMSATPPSPAAIYAGDDNAISVGIERNDFITLTPAGVNAFRGLTRHAYALGRTTQALTQIAPQSVTVTISAV